MPEKLAPDECVIRDEQQICNEDGELVRHDISDMTQPPEPENPDNGSGGLISSVGKLWAKAP